LRRRRIRLWRRSRESWFCAEGAQGAYVPEPNKKSAKADFLCMQHLLTYGIRCATFFLSFCAAAVASASGGF
jgi:hypothetical protein